MATSVLDREMFSEAEAARLLRVPQATLNYWLEGRTFASKTYKPIIRVKPRGSRSAVTWAEFIEAGLLREYRQVLKVPMAELRAFIDLLRARYEVPYPLAHRRPFVADRQLLLEAQEESGLDPDFCLVATVRGQLVLTYASESFVGKVTWEGDDAVGWHPNADSPVRIDPARRFGRPNINGVSTEALWEHVQAGESVREVAEEFALCADDVYQACAFEADLRRKAA